MALKVCVLVIGVRGTGDVGRRGLNLREAEQQFVCRMMLYFLHAVIIVCVTLSWKEAMQWGLLFPFYTIAVLV